MRRALRGMFAAVLVVVVVLAAACSGVARYGLLGENFPPHDIAFTAYAAPEFPYQLRATAIGAGYVIMVITVGRDGRVSDAVAIEASHRAFVGAVEAVIPQWVLAAQPAQTYPRREVVQFQFQRSGVATSVSHREAARKPFAEIEATQPEIRLVSAREFMPARVGSSDTRLPESAAEAGTGSVEVSFVIDTDGQVRVPVATLESDPALALEALQQVRRWRFEPPQIDGEAVVIEVATAVNFPPAPE